jgi:hypothetical protein
MTIVVGCVTPDIGFLVADTLLTSAFEIKGREGPVNGKYHALKVQILNSFTAIALAGDAEPAFQLIRNLNVELSQDSTISVPKRLFETYTRLIEDTKLRKPLDCEFLVLRLASDGRKLTHVTREEIRDCERAYIGDAEEYKYMKALQRPYLPPKTQHVQQPDGTFCIVPLVMSEGEIEFAEISNAIEELSQQRYTKGHSKSVGAISGGVTRVVDARISHELEYLQFGEVSLSTEEGHSGFSVLASNTGTRGTGIYFRSGRLGFLFIVGDSEPCRKEYTQTLNQFVAVAKAKYGLTLMGATWID